MSANLNPDLGLSCTSGEFYVCRDSNIKYLGCCSVDPCSQSQGCPESSVSAAGFNAEKYDRIQGQSCVSNNALWYTCASGPTFMGCCKSNPCNNGSICPDDDLVGAVLNGPKDASVFLTTAKPTSTTSTTGSTSRTTLTTSTTTTQTTSSASNNAHHGSSTPSIGGIVGGVIGGVIALGLIILIAYSYGRRRRKAAPLTNLGGQISPTSPPPWSPYHDTVRGSTAPRTSVSTLSTATTRHTRTSLNSIIGMKRLSGAKGRKSQVPADHEISPANLEPVAELEAPPPGAIYMPGSSHDTVYFEIPGSTPAEPRPPREMAS
ncbi:hypothetical protein GGS21DRAFT_200116 [Xylaria nigripes]|nr:hypothetical protein GGS21DRAFT_200116 [Xylaria nigripes]